MELSFEAWIKIGVALVVALIISFAVTPIIKTFAKQVGAIDVPDNKRHIHKQPIPRMGGLAIFIGFLFAVLLFADINQKGVFGVLLGAIMIVVVGALDDVLNLNAWLKFGVQILAAVVAVLSGVLIDFVTNPLIMSEGKIVLTGILAVPITILWIVGVTNSVNLIDGLDGLACGVSAIASMTMLVISMLVSDSNVNISVILAALTGACLGFIPYNLNPAKIFMGDTGALLLGYVLATVSVLGMFKTAAIVTFVVPVLAMAVPLSDTAFAFIRRLSRGQSPFHADRGHFHHRLLDMGLNQKQAVAVLYAVSAILGLTAVVIVSQGPLTIVVAAFAFIIAGATWLSVFRKNPNIHVHHTEAAAESEASEEEKCEKSE